MFPLPKGVWQTRKFNVFAYKPGFKNLVVFQPKNPKKINFLFQKFRNLKIDVFFFGSRKFYIFKFEKNVPSFDRDLKKVRTISIVTFSFLNSTHFAKFFVFLLEIHINPDFWGYINLKNEFRVCNTPLLTQTICAKSEHE